MQQVYILLGGRFVYVRQCDPSEATRLCERYAKMGTVAAHMPVRGGEVHWFPNKTPANNSRFLSSV